MNNVTSCSINTQLEFAMNSANRDKRLCKGNAKNICSDKNLKKLRKKRTCCQAMKITELSELINYSLCLAQMKKLSRTKFLFKKQIKFKSMTRRWQAMPHAIVPCREFQPKTCNCTGLQFLDSSNIFDMGVRTIIGQGLTQMKKRKKGKTRRRTLKVRDHLRNASFSDIYNYILQRQILPPYSKAEYCSAKNRLRKNENNSINIQ